MHLLVTQSGTIDDGAEPRDLGQTPGDIVVISVAETELALLARARHLLASASAQPSRKIWNRAWRSRGRTRSRACRDRLR